MKIKNRLSAIAVGVLIGGLSVLGASSPASAHEGGAAATCEALVVSLNSYAADNDITVVVDGETVVDETFTGSYNKTFSWEKTVKHAWSVDVVASDDEKFNYTNSGTTTPCNEPVTMTPLPPTVDCNGLTLPTNTEDIVYKETASSQTPDGVVTGWVVTATGQNGVLLTLDGINNYPTIEWALTAPTNCETTPTPTPSSYVPGGPTDDQTATPSPLPADTDDSQDGLAVTGPWETAGLLIAATLIIMAGVLVKVFSIRRKGALQK